MVSVVLALVFEFCMVASPWSELCSRIIGLFFQKISKSRPIMTQLTSFVKCLYVLVMKVLFGCFVLSVGFVRFVLSNSEPVSGFLE